MAAYSATVIPQAWSKPGFMAAGHPPYDCLLLVESTHGPISAARAAEVLNLDAYAKYFLEFQPVMWKFSHFTQYASRPIAWDWALNQALVDDSLNTEEARAR